MSADQCRLTVYDADYVGYTRRHLFQRIDEHKHLAIGKYKNLPSTLN